MQGKFIVQPPTMSDYIAALELLDEYNQRYEDGLFNRFMNKEVTLAKSIVVHEHNDNFRLCEMAFQMNFTQSPKFLCDMCAKELQAGEANTCGHLTFVSYIG